MMVHECSVHKNIEPVSRNLARLLSKDQISDESSKPFIDAMYQISKDDDCIFLDLVQLFENIPVKEWRYDNVHFTKYGNTYLANAVLNMILPGGGYYRKELVDAVLWTL